MKSSRSFATGGMKYWEAEEEPDTSSNIYRSPSPQARPKNIEVNAYILMTFVARKDVGNSLMVMRWLIKQRNGLGGYGSTQASMI